MLDLIINIVIFELVYLYNVVKFVVIIYSLKLNKNLIIQ